MENCPDLTNLPKKSKFAPKYIPTESILEFRSKGLTHAQIAQLLGCDRSAITQRLLKIDADLQILENYKKHRADIITLKGRQVLKNITPSKLQKASAYQLAGIFGLLYDKERTERNLSNQNISVQHQNIAYLRTIDDDK